MSEITIDQELSFAINSWLQHLKNIKKYSPHTLKSYITDLYYFLTFIHEHHSSGLNIKLMASLEVRDFRSWLAKRKLDGSKNTSSARALSVVRGFFKFLEKNYEFKNHELTFIKVKKLEKPLPKALNEQSVMLILDSISNVRGNWIDNRNRAILMLLYGAGLRISEAISICLKDIPKSSDTPFRIVGKGNKEKEIFLIPIIIDSIQEYIKACPFDVSNGPIFLGKNGGALAAGTFRKDLQTLRRLLNLPEYTTPHAFRHSFATHLLSKGGDIRVVQELLRHEAISTTQRYTKVDTFHLIDSYLKFHPKS